MFVIPANAKSWVPVDPASHFPIQNLPFGLACQEDEESEGVVVRIGDHVLDLCALSAAGLIPEDDFPVLHSLLDLEAGDLRRLRSLVFDLLRVDNGKLRDNRRLREEALLPIDEVDLMVPTEIPQFVDFYAGIHHASNVGRMFRPDHPPLFPNYRHMPLGYNGRASTIVASDIPVRRPNGQYLPPDKTVPIFGPTKELDFELELGFLIGEGNDAGEALAVDAAEAHILGLVMVNDWSARDIQRWETQPLGPFLAKSFATSVSPWIVSLDALEPFRTTGDEQIPAPLPHLQGKRPGHFDIKLEVAIQTEKMEHPQVISRTNARHLYWSLAQLLAHQTSNGTHLEPGDLYGTGTISGPDEGTFGSLLELTWKGAHPITMEETGETRTFLENGDTVIMTGYCEGKGYRIGFGELRTTVIE